MKCIPVRILPGFFIAVAAAVLLIPLPWLFAWILAAGVHELFHALAVWALRYSVLSISIGGGGAVIESNIPAGMKMSLCALAGPVGGMVLLLFLHTAPRIALCGLIQSLYNLLPLCHLDGGHALYGVLLSILPPDLAEKIAVILERIILFLLVVAGVYAHAVVKLGIIPLAFVSVLLFKNKKSLANKGT